MDVVVFKACGSGSGSGDLRRRCGKCLAVMAAAVMGSCLGTEDQWLDLSAAARAPGVALALS